MTTLNGVTTLAEGQYAFKTDVNIVFGKQRVERTHILRTTRHSLPVWKTRNPNVGLSPFKDRTIAVTRDAAIIDEEVWVFGIDATQSSDIVEAVKIASRHYGVSSSILLSDIYTKNLNADRENTMTNEALVRANKHLYANVCKALVEAARQLGISHQLNFYVFSKSNNPKIPGTDLSEALKTGGADAVTTDDHRPKVKVGSNSGADSIVQLTNFHLATLKV